jgi:hypothetical protein
MTFVREPGRLHRIMVVGTSCSGKSTLARRVSEALHMPHIELDVLNWGPGWSERPHDEFREIVQEAAARDRWVIDGNYGRVRDIVLPRATDAIWLNYPFPLVFWRAVARTARRVVTREELFGGNRETFRSAFLSSNSIPAWVIQTHRRYGRQYRLLFENGEGAAVRVVELRNPGEANAFVASIGGE